MPCFPMRAMQFSVHVEPSRALLNVTLEPQGTLRVKPLEKMDTITLDLGGMWWDPDVLSKESTLGNGRAAIFPIDMGTHAERKGFVKDAYLYDTNKGNKCGCWVQKRLV